MASFAAGIFSHAVAAQQSLTDPNPTSALKPQAGGTSGTSSSTATISANDFLTLLVTEMKNQDPTANNDPNAYINQLVSVNSLEQLIDINQNLSSALGTSGKTAATAAAGQIPPVSNPQPSTVVPKGAGQPAANSAASSSSTGGNLAALTAAVKRAPGNLTIPDAAPAATTVAHALDGRRPLVPHATGLR